MMTALRDLGLDAIVARAGGLDSEHDWPATLSLREQQLFALAHVMLARPAFVMLDGVDVVLEAVQFRHALARLAESSVTYVVLSERAEFTEEYDAVLELSADGTWSWRPRAPSTASP
jgi:vitamin B12/bleomycin/antimicrobial peptide transport system ATP-binding/permease protein